MSSSSLETGRDYLKLTSERRFMGNLQYQRALQHSFIPVDNNGDFYVGTINYLDNGIFLTDFELLLVISKSVMFLLM